MASPASNQCLIHLKLLQAFYQLRASIEEQDGLFGLSDTLPAAPELVREKRWQVYVTRAVNRFEVWWNTSSLTREVPAQILRTFAVDRQVDFDQLPERALPREVTASHLPPLDVLMVWHTYLLNPRDMLEDSLRSAKLEMWTTGLPLVAINAALDDVKATYQPGSDARQRFEAETGLPWDNLYDITEKQVMCPRCQALVLCPWTALPPTPAGSDAALNFSEGTGFADKSFRKECPSCKFTITHDGLRVQKFRLDMQRLLEDDRPMPGTLLSVKGTLDKPTTLKSPITGHLVGLPNRLLKTAGVSTTIRAATDFRSFPNSTVTEIKNAIESTVRPDDHYFRQLATGRPGRQARLLPAEKIAIRRMMSRYWDNSSPFALDLVGAVLRQAVFVKKMHDLDWLHDPSAPIIMARLVEKYHRFFYIMKKKPGNVVVPTLDVDLAWHTHQLHPQSYYIYSIISSGGRFVDHDDKIEVGKLDDAFAWTSKQYQKMFNAAYSECACPYCEKIQPAPHRPSAFRRLFASSKTAQPRSTSPPPAYSEKDRVHFSAHNAVKPPPAAATGNGTARFAFTGNTRAERLAELHAMKQRRLAEKTSSARGMSGGHGIGTHPYDDERNAGLATNPMLAQLESERLLYSTGLYAANPGCVATGSGTPGNCVAGACGGTVANGGCAGGGAAGFSCGSSGGGCGGGDDAGGGGGAACGGGGGGCGGGGCGGGGS